MSHSPNDGRNAFERMLEYGRATVRALFLLNGAAMIALMTLVSSLIEHHPGEGAAASLVPALWAFVAGLGCAVLFAHARWS